MNILRCVTQRGLGRRALVARQAHPRQAAAQQAQQRSERAATDNAAARGQVAQAGGCGAQARHVPAARRLARHRLQQHAWLGARRPPQSAPAGTACVAGVPAHACCMRRQLLMTAPPGAPATADVPPCSARHCRAVWNRAEKRPLQGPRVIMRAARHAHSGPGAPARSPRAPGKAERGARRRPRPACASSTSARRSSGVARRGERAWRAHTASSAAPTSSSSPAARRHPSRYPNILTTLS